MILEGLVVATVANTLYKVDKSTKIDERALKKYGQAFEKCRTAELMIQQKAELVDKRLLNVAKKKRAIIEMTIPQFVQVYSQIQKIELENKSSVIEFKLPYDTKKLSIINALSINTKKHFTDKELVLGLLIKGFGGVCINDSERNLSAANCQLRSANVAYSQSESIVAVYDAIIGRADRIAKLLMAMNALFIRSIEETKITIESNGSNVSAYSNYDKGVLMTCVNIASAIADIINIPVVDEKGAISESAVKMLETGENYLNKINKVINS